MNNIISADIYRVKRGATVRNVMIATVVITILMALLISFMSSNAMQDMMNTSANLVATQSDEVAEMQASLGDFQALFSGMKSAAGFTTEMLGQASVLMFFLPLVLAVFCADFSAGAHRNTLSFESNRGKVYASKFVLSAVLSLLLVLFTIIVSWLIGAIVFGKIGFSAGYFGEFFVSLLLQLPIYIACVAVIHFLIAFTKKSGMTIAAFFIVLVGMSPLLQGISMALPKLDWLTLLDPMSAVAHVIQYKSMETSRILIIIVYNLIVAAAAYISGLIHFKKVDMP